MPVTSLGRRILMITLSSTDHDNRVRNTGKSLADAGYSVRTVSLGSAHRLGPDDLILPRSAGRLLGIPGLATGLVTLRLIRSLWRLRDVVDAYHCHDLPALVFGVLACRTFNRAASLVYDAHEFETEQRPPPHGLRHRLFCWLERNCLPWVDEMITVSPLIATAYAERYGIAVPTIVLNCPPFRPRRATDLLRSAHGIAPGARIFLYQGGMSPGRGIPESIAAFAEADPTHAVLVFMGYGLLAETVERAATLYPAVIWQPAVSPEVLPDYTASADVGIVLIEDTCLSHRYSLPNKLFECIMARIPVVGSPLPEISRVIRESGVGVIATEINAAGIAAAVREVVRLDPVPLADALDRAAEVYCWEQQARVLASLYERLTCAA
ncbi:MAG: glycosyltransferase family 4 protein [Gemmatimonadota bacterium]